MRPYLGHGAYRKVVAGGLVYIVGPGGVPHGELTAWAREQLAPVTAASPPLPGWTPQAVDPVHQTRSRFKVGLETIRVVLDAINSIHTRHPAVVEELMRGEVATVRKFVETWLEMKGCTVRNGRRDIDGRIVTPRDADAEYMVVLTLTRFRQLFDHWRATGTRTTHSPMQMEPSRSRISGERRSRSDGTRVWMDVDSYFRVKSVARAAPRPGDQSIFRDILQQGRKMGWPDAVELLFEGVYLTGARPGQLRIANAYGLLVAAPDESKIKLVQKGSGGLLAWDARMPPGYRERVLAMLDARVEGGLAHLRRLAASEDPLEQAKLKLVPIFSLDGVAAIPQWKLNHLFRLAVEALDLFVLDHGDDTAAPVRRWPTPHWLRHAFCNRVLDRIAEAELDEAQRERARDRLAAYMGWKLGRTMLEYYGRYHFLREVDRMLSDYQGDLEDEAADIVGRDLIPANDNGLMEWGRAVGGDLVG